MLSPTPPDTGRLDIHSHLLPGIDDGCVDLEESIACVGLLKEQGYVGSICTPHYWVQMYPDNSQTNIEGWVATLRREFAQRSIDYQIWPGAEVRLDEYSIRDFKSRGVPTLADSRCVLCDSWFDRWPRWFDKTFDWLLAEGYQPILAHPERLKVETGLGEKLQALTDRGVWLQGNFQAFTGELGYLPDRYVRQFMDEGRYTFLAMDMHRPAALPGRIDGLEMAREEYNAALVETMLVDRPREMILNCVAG